MIIAYDELKSIRIGHERDNVLPQYKINVARLAEKWTDATISLIVTRPTETGGYLADTVVEDGVMTWTIHRGDVAIVGQGCGQIVVSRGEEEFWHGDIFATIISNSLAKDGITPEVPTDLLDRVIAASGTVLRISEQVTAQVAEVNRLAEQVSKDADRAKNAADESGKYADESEGFANDAKGFADNAGKSADDALFYSKISEQAASENGYFFFDVNDDGHLIYTKTDNVTELDFRMDENGHLEVIYE